MTTLNVMSEKATEATKREGWPALPVQCQEPAEALSARLEEERGREEYTVNWERTLHERARAIVDAALRAPSQYGLSHASAQYFHDNAADKRMLIAAVIIRASMFWPLSLLIYGRPKAEEIRRAAGIWALQNVEGTTELVGEPEEFRGTSPRDADQRVVHWLRNRVLSVDTSGSGALTTTTPMVEPTYPTAGRGAARFAAMVDPAMAGDCALALTIRLKVHGGPESLDELAATGMMDVGCATFLRWLVLGKRNIVFAGDTGTGKTTAMIACVREIPASEWLVTIEESAELELRRPLRDGRPAHAWTIEATEVAAGSTQKAPADLIALTRHALRHRPDRIVLGEARGGEFFQVAKSMISGHPGSMTSVHALSSSEVRERLLVLLLEAPSKPSEEFANRLINMSMHVCVMLANRHGKHLVDEVTVFSEDGAPVRVYQREDGPGGRLRRCITHMDGLPERIQRALRPFGVEVPGQ